jgi:hypothetical protein
VNVGCGAHVAHELAARVARRAELEHPPVAARGGVPEAGTRSGTPRDGSWPRSRAGRSPRDRPGGRSTRRSRPLSRSLP